MQHRLERVKRDHMENVCSNYVRPNDQNLLAGDVDFYVFEPI